MGVTVSVNHAGVCVCGGGEVGRGGGGKRWGSQLHRVLSHVTHKADPSEKKAA